MRRLGMIVFAKLSIGLQKTMIMREKLSLGINKSWIYLSPFWAGCVSKIATIFENERKNLNFQKIFIE